MKINSQYLPELKPTFNPSFYGYDANGNMTSDGTYSFGYDYENRLTSAVGNGHSASYTYDALGRRRSKTVDGAATYFLYDAPTLASLGRSPDQSVGGDQVIAEYNASNTLLKKFIFGSGIDEPLVMKTFSASYYYLFDGLGSVTGITDSTGSTVETYTYDVYGKPNQASSLGNRLVLHLLNGMILLLGCSPKQIIAE